jgi:hypothetical protein
VLDGAGGRDTILADDGEPDRVVCGTNSPSGGRELDVAFVDRRDRVAPDCELLYRDGHIDLRRGRTAVRIDVWAGDPSKLVFTRTLRCSPPGGTLAHAVAACRALRTMRGALAPVPTGTLCVATLPAFRRARVAGAVGGVAVLVAFSRYNACEAARWDRHRFLLEGR